MKAVPIDIPEPTVCTLEMIKPEESVTAAWFYPQLVTVAMTM